MPWIDTSTPQSENAQKWQLAIKNSLLRRLNADQVSDAFKTLHTQYRVMPSEIATILLGFRATKAGTDDPLLFNYARFLLKAKCMTTSHLLLALLKHSHFHNDKSSQARPISNYGLPSCEERFLLLMTTYHMTTDLPSSPLELQTLVYAIYRWLKAVREYEAAQQIEGAGLHTVDVYSSAIYDALGQLALSVLGNQGVRAFTKQRWWRAKRSQVVTEMVTYATHILQWINADLANRLRLLTGVLPYIELDGKGKPVFTDQQILESISDVPVVQSRAGLFVWLNAALTARPLTDDMVILSFLHARYPGDSQTSIQGLLVASFDVFTNALLRKESQQTQRLIRSFVCNKVPVLLSMLSASIAAPMSVESCIQMTLIEPPAGVISMSPLPPITAGADDVRESLKKLRLEFLQACALHGHITEATIGSILRENVALPRVIKYNKDTLVAQCANNVSKLDGLIADLDAMQGNAGAIAGCIVETVNNLCVNKDSMSLKQACNELLKRAASMDVVMLFAQPSMLLLPLCTLLNEWHHDQEQTEFTPSYEEFASILLFTVLLIYRYDLDMAEIGLPPNSFISRLLSEMSISHPPTDLSEEQNSQLSKWIEGLFAVDEHGETSGIGDDVMRQCSPQSFYQLVPTLFEQSVLACRSSALSMKTFKGGLELLLEPFLLPSLVMGLRWVADHSWEDHNDAQILLQVLEKLLKPSSTSQDVRAMHGAILAMVATPLCESLQTLVQKWPTEKKAGELIDLLKRYAGSQRSLRCRKEDIDIWIQEDGSLERRMQRSVQELVNWAATPSNPPNPPPRYAYREFAVSCQVLEADIVLQALVQELQQTSNLPIALDVCNAMICSPASMSVTGQQSIQYVGPTSKLRENVRLIGSNIQGLLDKKLSKAEALVRLGKRVAAQLAVVQLPPITMPIQMQEQTTDQIMQDLGMDLLVSHSNANVDGNMDQNTSIGGLDQELDISNPSDQEIANLAANTGSMDIDQTNIFGDLNIDLGQSRQNDQQLDLVNQEEDIFAGLDMGMGDLGDDFFG